MLVFKGGRRGREKEKRREKRRDREREGKDDVERLMNRGERGRIRKEEEGIYIYSYLYIYLRTHTHTKKRINADVVEPSDACFLLSHTYIKPTRRVRCKCGKH